MDTDLNTGDFFVHAKYLNTTVMFRYAGTLPVMARTCALYVYSFTHKRMLRETTPGMAASYLDHVMNGAPVVDDNWMRTHNYLPRVLTKAEAQERVSAGYRITTVSSSDHNAFFFTNDHCHSLRVDPPLANCWVAGSSSIPMRVKERRTLPSGIIQNVQDYLIIFHSDEVCLETQADLDKCIAEYDPAVRDARRDAEAAMDPHYNGYDHG